jgi:hypothetical protein
LNIRCIQCKGRNFCGRSFCPILSKINSQKKVNLDAKKDFFGAAPNVFIGRYGYPNINVGLLSAEQYNQHDSPLIWSEQGYDIDSIINLRTELINSRFRTNIRTFNDKLFEVSQEVSMASKPVDVEVNLKKKPYFNLNFNQDVIPHGPSVKLEKAKITENPKIPTKVDKVVSEIDLKANDALKILHKKNFDEHYLTKLLSVGNLGVKTERKLVPTRWAITAVDDHIGKELITKIKQHNNTGYLAFFGGYLGNYYLILSFPDVWGYELFETYVGGKNKENATFATDYENYGGRKTYADNTAGGYYAARLSVLEKLNQMKKQGSILCLRFITGEYWAPLGVWVCREATRKSMKAKPIEFASEELMMKYAKNFVRKKFGFNLDNITRKSKLLKEMKSQKKLTLF